MGACWSDSNINQKPDRFNVRKLPNEVVLDTEYAIKKQDPDINFYYNGKNAQSLFRSETKKDCRTWNHRKTR